MTYLSRRGFCTSSVVGAALGMLHCAYGARSSLLIAVLSTGHNDSAIYDSLDRQLRQGLLEFTPQLRVMRREAGFSSERLASQADELMNLRPNVLICLDLTAALLAVSRRRDRNLPIVFMAHADPLAYHLIQSYAHPGNNITGVTTFRCVDGKMVEILAHAFAKRRHIGYLLDGSALQEDCIRLADETAARLGVRLTRIDIGSPGFLDNMAAALRTLHLDAVIAPASSPLWQNRAGFVRRLNDLRLPTIYESDLFLREGGLMCYGPIRADAISQVAANVRKILLGEPAGDIPIEQPTLFELVINLRAPYASDYDISASTLRRADRILQ